jgi:malate dehydrogenase
VEGAPLTELLGPEQIRGVEEKTVAGGAEVVALLRTGSAFFAPSASVHSMLRSILRDEGRIMPTSTLLQGEFGISDIFLGVPARLGRGGVAGIVELELNEAELAALQAAAASVSQRLKELDL